MIYDKLDNIDKYDFLQPQIKKALELAKNIEFQPGEREFIDVDENIRIQKMSFNKFFDINFGELHFEHIDIHLFAGDVPETIYFNNDVKYTQNDILNSIPEKDVIFIKAPEYHNQITVNKGYFALFFPGELHKVTMTQDIENKDKLLIKVKI